ncbi:MAG: imidazoleglycerol-phosphate dehydratase HisB [Clostridiaceae bacterium]|nr:imidazoleglycerol-phosphate dehydratase HisB [Clostridiaceae bacterium]
MNKRSSEIKRKTGETDIEISFNIQGEGNSNIDTGVGFLDHMLTLFSKHGGFDLSVKAKGDLYVDSHHTIEDIGIVLGQCIKEASGDRKGIKRYGTSFLPMDESMAMVSVDVSGRPYLVFDAALTVEKLGNFDTEMTEEFFRALAFNAGITLHAKILYGKNTHHMIEALFKGTARALKEALTEDETIKGVMSTKGIL